MAKSRVSRVRLSLGAGLIFLVIEAPVFGAPSFDSNEITGAACCKNFALRDHHGVLRTIDDFRGKVVLVTFGFLRCPDVCPTTLAKLNGLMQKLGQKADEVQVLFISLDPDRDTSQHLGAYVTAFNPAFIGLSGDDKSTARAANEFRVFYKKRPGRTANDYTIDHSVGTYVLDRSGNVRLFAFDPETDAFASDIRTLLSIRTLN